ncbi:MAG: hypothetical protein NWF05_10115 [Candidatus Bathyarchaeota archaeon]|nr:hypothetical protein [Candidatus Bathyarchaeota archaeon]
MAKDEGLYSPKAIVFIQSKGSRSSFRLETKTYFTVRSRIEKAADFLEPKKRVVNRLNVSLMKKLGDQEWIN